MSTIYERNIKLDKDKQIIEMDTLLKRRLHYEYSNGNIISVTDNEDFVCSYINHETGKIKSYSDTDGVEITYGYHNGRLDFMIINSREDNNIIRISNEKHFIIIGYRGDNKVLTERVFDLDGILIDYYIIKDQYDYDRYEQNIYKQNLDYEVNKIDNNTMELVFQ